MDCPSFYSSEDAYVKRFLAGSLAGVTSQTLTYPLDLARARMAVTDKGLYDSLRSVSLRLKNIYSYPY